MEKQAEGASWATPVLLCTTHISGLLLSFRVYLSPLVSCTWDKDTKPSERLGFPALGQFCPSWSQDLEQPNKNPVACLF